MIVIIVGKVYGDGDYFFVMFLCNVFMFVLCFLFLCFLCFLFGLLVLYFLCEYFVVDLVLFSIGEDGVGFVDFLECCIGFGFVVGVVVWVLFYCGVVVSVFDFV